MNAFRDAVAALRDLTRAELAERLQDAVAHSNVLGVAAVLAEMNARDCHDYETPGYNLEQAARDVDDALEEAYE